MKRTVRLNKGHEAIVDETNLEDVVSLEGVVKKLFFSGIQYDDAVKQYEAKYLSEDPDGAIFDKVWEEYESEK